MFLYESLSGLVGMLVLIWIARRFAQRLRPGDMLLVFFIWYGSVRFVVESLKADNWVFFGVPMAQIIAAITVVGATAMLVLRHRSGGVRQFAALAEADPPCRQRASRRAEPPCGTATAVGAGPLLRRTPAHIDRAGMATSRRVPRAGSVSRRSRATGGKSVRLARPAVTNGPRYL